MVWIRVTGRVPPASVLVSRQANVLSGFAQPGPDHLRRRVDRDGTGRSVLRVREHVVARQARRDLARWRAPPQMPVPVERSREEGGEVGDDVTDLVSKVP
jgi:hypothetical protein